MTTCWRCLEVVWSSMRPRKVSRRRVAGRGRAARALQVFRTWCVFESKFKVGGAPVVRAPTRLRGSNPPWTDSTQQQDAPSSRIDYWMPATVAWALPPSVHAQRHWGTARRIPYQLNASSKSTRCCLVPSTHPSVRPFVSPHGRHLQQPKTE